MNSDFLVMKWDWLEEALSDDEINTLYYLLRVASEDKPECHYYVVDTKEPYAEQVKDILDRKGKVQEGRQKISRFELLKALKELEGDYSDPEASHAEADELLLNYINDLEIESLFYKIPKWYA